MFLLWGVSTQGAVARDAVPMFDVPRIKRCETKPYSFESLDPEKPFVLHTKPLQQSRNELVLRFSLRESETLKAIETAQEKARLAREAAAKAHGDKEELSLALVHALTAHEEALNLRAIEVVAHCCVASWENVTETVDALDENGSTIRKSVAVSCTPENVLRFLKFMYAPAEEQGAGRADDVRAYLSWAARSLTFTEVLRDGAELGKE